jgi:ADP-heptose:LPS heptosyltransferase
MNRTLTLRNGLSYTIGNLCFRKDEPKPVDDSLLYRLIQTGQFEEDPPLCYYYIRRKKNLPNRRNRLSQINGDWLMISSENPVKVSRYQWSKLEASGQFEIVPPCEIMDMLVSREREDFTLLIIRDMGAGDVIITTDLVYNLRLRYPKARITYATSERYVCLIKNLDFIDDVVAIGEVHPNDYDISVNLCGWSEQYPICAKVHRSDLFGMAFSDKFDWREHKICLKIDPDEQEWYEALNKTHNPDGNPVVAIQPYGSSGHRSLDPVAVNQTIDWLISQGFFVIVYGERQWPNLFHSRPGMVCLWSALTIRQVITITANVELLICPDSSGYHMAAAFDTPSIAVFTTIHEGVRVSYYPRCLPLRTSELNCSPCWDRPCGLPEASDCIRKITGVRLIEAISEFIESGFAPIEHPQYNPPDWD